MTSTATRRPAIAMDDTVFLLASPEEHDERSVDPPEEMGIVLGVAVLLDAFLVRLVLLPVMLRLAGRAAGWSPRWLTRVLPTITFSHG